MCQAHHLKTNAISESSFMELAKSTGNNDWQEIKYLATQPDGTRVAFYREPIIVEDEFGKRWAEPFSGAIPVGADSNGGQHWEFSLTTKPSSFFRRFKSDRSNAPVELRRPITANAVEARITHDGHYQEKISWDSGFIWRCDCGAITCRHGKTFFERWSWAIYLAVWGALVVTVVSAVLPTL